ncbi:helix-turn-helix transcriptional regulator [Desulforamulus ruminis]|uniref:Transcriptional regulator, DeoR family n=1 Tax=Desulforamulus ruminis (strain ATCC 23193 / DSM 2154 / NCIMB 8452 / DL) TaxID=696281 RepID=F6DLS0_DESRL|nr:YafY family protein [Desulforamulus ruminis]AEG58363.1 transcriptional regulator, DeoR family [Desulforamulus ruminis DSM 2154]
MKLERLISILVILLRRQRVQAKELAEMFEVSVRTILRDVEAINLAGIPIVTYQGAKGGIGLAEGYRLDKSILTSHEMAAIITMLKGIGMSVPDIGHEILQEKLKNTLSPAQAKFLDAKTNQLFIDLSPWGGNRTLAEKVGILRKAIENLTEVELKYTDSSGAKTLRRVQPYSLVLKGQNWYLYAWCLLRGEFRLFKLSRMKEINILETRFQPQEVSLQPFPWEEEWSSPGGMVELELVFDKEMEAVVEEWFAGNLVQLEDGRIRIEISLPENNWLYGFLLSFGTGVEVIRPSRLRKILADQARGILKKYV